MKDINKSYFIGMDLHVVKRKPFVFYEADYLKCYDDDDITGLECLILD